MQSLDRQAQGEILRKINRPNTGCLANPIHFYRAQNEYRDIDNLPVGSLKYCQLCDITAEMPDTMDGILYQVRNFRLFPGTGGPTSCSFSSTCRT